MRTIIKLTVCTLMLFSFTACFPILMTSREEGHGRWYYNNHNYNNRREYRDARRHVNVDVRVDPRSNDNRDERR